MKSSAVTIQMNDIEQNEQYFPVVQFIYLYKVILTFDHSNQSLQKKW